MPWFKSPIIAFSLSLNFVCKALYAGLPTSDVSLAAKAWFCTWFASSCEAGFLPLSFLLSPAISVMSLACILSSPVNEPDCLDFKVGGVSIFFRIRESTSFGVRLSSLLPSELLIRASLIAGSWILTPSWICFLNSGLLINCVSKVSDSLIICGAFAGSIVDTVGLSRIMSVISRSRFCDSSISLGSEAVNCSSFSRKRPGTFIRVLGTAWTDSGMYSSIKISNSDLGSNGVLASPPFWKATKPPSAIICGAEAGGWGGIEGCGIGGWGAFICGGTPICIASLPAKLKAACGMVFKPLTSSTTVVLGSWFFCALSLILALRVISETTR